MTDPAGYAEYAATPEGQARLAASIAASGGKQVVPDDLLNYLKTTGLDQTPRWKRVLSGANPISGGPTSFGWEGPQGPALTRDRQVETTTKPKQIYDPQSGTFYDDPTHVPVTTHTVEQDVVQSPAGASTFKDRSGQTFTVPGGPEQEDLGLVRAPIYFDGDEDVEYAKMTNEQKAWAKQMMRDTGLLSADAGGVGATWDNAAFSAFSEVLRYSNAKGVSWRSSMSGMRDYLEMHPEEKAGTKGGATLPAFTPNVANPADLRKVFEQASTKITGKLDPALVDRFVASYQAEQTRAQRQAYDATYAPGETGVGPGGTVVNAPSPDVAAEEYLRQANPAAAGGTDIANVMGDFMDIIGGMGSG
jgi:hypothetical protein